LPFGTPSAVESSHCLAGSSCFGCHVGDAHPHPSVSRSYVPLRGAAPRGPRHKSMTVLIFSASPTKSDYSGQSRNLRPRLSNTGLLAGQPATGRRMSVHTASAGAMFAPTRIGLSLNETFLIGLAGLPGVRRNTMVPFLCNATPSIWSWSDFRLFGHHSGGSCR
jgi:hypothetical protein